MGGRFPERLKIEVRFPCAASLIVMHLEEFVALAYAIEFF
jgi:hypothetical protein